ncbi:hypothetical protein HDU92_001119 [Lobulomyces angularis]|nr:hypothetical protein HDU92_001119 [Lobulomyces angularis]
MVEGASEFEFVLSIPTVKLKGKPTVTFKFWGSQEEFTFTPNTLASSIKTSEFIQKIDFGVLENDNEVYCTFPISSSLKLFKNYLKDMKMFYFSIFNYGKFVGQSEFYNISKLIQENSVLTILPIYSGKNNVTEIGELILFLAIKEKKSKGKENWESQSHKPYNLSVNNSLSDIVSPIPDPTPSSPPQKKTNEFSTSPLQEIVGNSSFSNSPLNFSTSRLNSSNSPSPAPRASSTFESLTPEKLNHQRKNFNKPEVFSEYPQMEDMLPNYKPKIDNNFNSEVKGEDSSKRFLWDQIENRMKKLDNDINISLRNENLDYETLQSVMPSLSDDLLAILDDDANPVELRDAAKAAASYLEDSNSEDNESDLEYHDLVDDDLVIQALNMSNWEPKKRNPNVMTNKGEIEDALSDDSNLEHLELESSGFNQYDIEKNIGSPKFAPKKKKEKIFQESNNLDFTNDIHSVIIKMDRVQVPVTILENYDIGLPNVDAKYNSKSVTRSNWTEIQCEVHYFIPNGDSDQHSGNVVSEGIPKFESKDDNKFLVIKFTNHRSIISGKNALCWKADDKLDFKIIFKTKKRYNVKKTINSNKIFTSTGSISCSEIVDSVKNNKYTGHIPIWTKSSFVGDLTFKLEFVKLEDMTKNVNKEVIENKRTRIYGSKKFNNQPEDTTSDNNRAVHSQIHQLRSHNNENPDFVPVVEKLGLQKPNTALPNNVSDAAKTTSTPSKLSLNHTPLYVQLNVGKARAFSLLNENVPTLLYLSVRLFFSSVIESPTVLYSRSSTSVEEADFQFSYSVPISVDEEFIKQWGKSSVVVEVWVIESNPVLDEKFSKSTFLKSKELQVDGGRRLLGLLRLPVGFLISAAIYQNSEKNDRQILVPAAGPMPYILANREYPVLDPFAGGGARAFVSVEMKLGTLDQIKYVEPTEIEQKSLRSKSPEKKMTTPVFTPTKLRYSPTKVKSKETKLVDKDTGMETNECDIQVTIFKMCGLVYLLERYFIENNKQFNFDDENFVIQSYITLDIFPDLSIDGQGDDFFLSKDCENDLTLVKTDVAEGSLPEFDHCEVLTLEGIDSNLLNWIRNGGRAKGKLFCSFQKKDDNFQFEEVGRFTFVLRDIIDRPLGINNLWVPILSPFDSDEVEIHSAVNLSVKILSGFDFGEIIDAASVKLSKTYNPFYLNVNITGLDARLETKDMNDYVFFFKFLYPVYTPEGLHIETKISSEYNVTCYSTKSDGVLEMTVNFKGAFHFDGNPATYQWFRDNNFTIQLWRMEKDFEKKKLYLGSAFIDVWRLLDKFKRSFRKIYSKKNSATNEKSCSMEKDQFLLINENSPDLNTCYLKAKISILEKNSNSDAVLNEKFNNQIGESSFTKMARTPSPTKSNFVSCSTVDDITADLNIKLLIGVEEFKLHSKVQRNINLRGNDTFFVAFEWSKASNFLSKTYKTAEVKLDGKFTEIFEIKLDNFNVDQLNTTINFKLFKKNSKGEVKELGHCNVNLSDLYFLELIYGWYNLVDVDTLSIGEILISVKPDDSGLLLLKSTDFDVLKNGGDSKKSYQKENSEFHSDSVKSNLRADLENLQNFNKKAKESLNLSQKLKSNEESREEQFVVVEFNDSFNEKMDKTLNEVIKVLKVNDANNKKYEKILKNIEEHATQTEKMDRNNYHKNKHSRSFTDNSAVNQRKEDEILTIYSTKDGENEKLTKRKFSQSPDKERSMSINEDYSTPLNKMDSTQLDKDLTESKEFTLPNKNYHFASSPSHRSTSPHRNNATYANDNSHNSLNKVNNFSPNKYNPTSPTRNQSGSPINTINKNHSTSPDREKSASPKRNHPFSPHRENSTSPNRNHAASPRRDGSTSPDRNHPNLSNRAYSASPNRNHAASPRRDGSISPDTNHPTLSKQAYSTSPDRNHPTVTNRAYSTSSDRNQPTVSDRAYSTSPDRNHPTIDNRNESSSPANRNQQSSPSRNSNSPKKYDVFTDKLRPVSPSRTETVAPSTEQARYNRSSSPDTIKSTKFKNTQPSTSFSEESKPLNFSHEPPSSPSQPSASASNSNRNLKVIPKKNFKSEVSFSRVKSPEKYFSATTNYDTTAKSYILPAESQKKRFIDREVNFSNEQGRDGKNEENFKEKDIINIYLSNNHDPKKYLIERRSKSLDRIGSRTNFFTSYEKQSNNFSKSIVRIGRSRSTSPHAITKPSVHINSVGQSDSQNTNTTQFSLKNSQNEAFAAKSTKFCECFKFQEKIPTSQHNPMEDNSQFLDNKPNTEENSSLSSSSEEREVLDFQWLEKKRNERKRLIGSWKDVGSFGKKKTTTIEQKTLKEQKKFVFDTSNKSEIDRILKIYNS